MKHHWHIRRQTSPTADAERRWDQALLAQFALANERVIKELTDLSVWLEKDLLPRSKGNYAIGAENFAKQLEYEELVDIPLPRLLGIALATLHRDQAKFAALDEEKKQRIAAVTTIMLDTAKAKEAFEAGRYDEAFKVARANASAAQAFEIQTSGKAGDLTASGLSRLSWYALFARQYATALDAAERSIKLKPDDLEPETNRAHALMFLGRATEAKTIYVAHKGEPLNGKKWEEVIADDFVQLRKVGIESPLMAEIEAAFKAPAASASSGCPIINGKPLCV